MKKVTMYHNARCSKSREALQLLKDEGCEVELKEYMKETPSKKELKELLAKLGIKASELVRKKEELYKTKYADKKFTETEWLQILIENPVLIERPIVIDGYKAVIGRPPELIVDLIHRKK